mmetsp:Transcript_2575/g.5587  ORF Transcript_2575/g.5587 Transcript_2575/m.5587 type:complete len:95 (+) Transcript_2575:642-926(+)
MLSLEQVVLELDRPNSTVSSPLIQPDQSADRFKDKDGVGGSSTSTVSHPKCNLIKSFFNNKKKHRHCVHMIVTVLDDDMRRRPFLRPTVRENSS